MTGEELAEAALSLVGTRFRLQGRDPLHGLDCIGLLEAALGRAGRKVTLPAGYALRMTRIETWLPEPAGCGFAPAEPPFETGDIVLLQAGVGQVHLAIAVSGTAWVHAHAGLRRVVACPAIPDGAVLHHWRLLPTS
jgi:hypothetical protein